MATGGDAQTTDSMKNKEKKDNEDTIEVRDVREEKFPDTETQDSAADRDGGDKQEAHVLEMLRLGGEDDGKEVIWIAEQRDGNWKGWAAKEGKAVSARAGDPNTVLNLLIAHSGK